MALPGALEDAAAQGMLFAVQRAVQDALQEALDNVTAAAALAGGATLSAAAEAQAGGGVAYTFSVGLPAELPAAAATAGAARRALTGSGAGTANKLAGLNVFLQQRLHEAGVPDVDALFSSGALSLRLEEVAPPPAAVAPLAVTAVTDNRVAIGVGIGVGLAGVVAIFIALYLAGSFSVKTAAGGTGATGAAQRGVTGVAQPAAQPASKVALPKGNGIYDDTEGIFLSPGT